MVTSFALSLASESGSCDLLPPFSKFPALQRGRWTAEEVSWLESNCGWALLEQMVEGLSRSPIDIIRQLNVLGLVTNGDFDRLLFEIRMFE